MLESLKPKMKLFAKKKKEDFRPPIVNEFDLKRNVDFNTLKDQNVSISEI